MDETKLVRLDEGDVLFREGDVSREMYILWSGKVRVLLAQGGKRIPLRAQAFLAAGR